MRDQKNIRVNHLVIDDYYGAGRAAIRISQALMCNGVESNVYVLDLLKNEGCVQVRLTNVEKIKRKIFNRLNYEMVKSYKAGAMFNAEIYGDVYKDLKYLDADIIHLHFLNHGFWSKKFADVVMKRNIPVVWTLHDMWPFTGGCHYTGNCEKFTNMCSNCEILDSTRENDLAQKCLLQKIFLYSKMNIRFIGCSSWITKEANRSIIFKKLGIKCINIPNPVAGIPFVFIDKKEARKLLGINSQKKIICFGAQSATSDKRKGYKYLRKAIRMLSNNDYMLLVFGSNYQDKFLDGFQIITTGQVTDDFHLSLIYNAADVFVSPSIQENFKVPHFVKTIF